MTNIYSVMETVLSDQLKDQVKISVIAWLIIILMGVVMYFTIFKIVTMHLIAESSFFNEIQSSAVESQEGIQILDEMSTVKEKILLFYYATLAFCSIGLMSGIGILKRRNIGRIIFTVLSIILILGIVGVLIYFRFKLEGESTESFGWINFVEIRKIQKTTLIFYGIFFIAIARSLLKSILKLNSKPFRPYFK